VVQEFRTKQGKAEKGEEEEMSKKKDCDNCNLAKNLSCTIPTEMCNGRDWQPIPQPEPTSDEDKEWMNTALGEQKEKEVSPEVRNTVQIISDLRTKLAEKDAEIERLKNENLYLEFGDGKIACFTSVDNKLILSKRHGTGVIGQPALSVRVGDVFFPSGNDVVMKFKNIESLLVVKKSIEEIEEHLRTNP
jgi:hypothetical protein